MYKPKIQEYNEETDRVNATQKSSDIIVEGAVCNGARYLNCNILAMQKFRYLIIKVMILPDSHGSSSFSASSLSTNFIFSGTKFKYNLAVIFSSTARIMIYQIALFMLLSTLDTCTFDSILGFKKAVVYFTFLTPSRLKKLLRRIVFFSLAFRFVV